MYILQDYTLFAGLTSGDTITYSENHKHTIDSSYRYSSYFILCLVQCECLHISILLLLGKIYPILRC
jgi:hypothetical protein